MNAIVDKQCVWPNCVIKKTLKLDCFLARVWTSRHTKHISLPYSRI